MEEFMLVDLGKLLKKFKEYMEYISQLQLWFSGVVILRALLDCISVNRESKLIRSTAKVIL